MGKQEELDKQLKKYRKQYQKLLKSDKAVSGRYGNEDLNIQLQVLEAVIAEIQKEIVRFKKKG